MRLLSVNRYACYINKQIYFLLWHIVKFAIEFEPSGVQFCLKSYARFQNPIDN